ncbi:MAG: hypothetical protein DRP47_04000 [Candidatus Zixiibacteriota bacterium]|nr:MAG: hypothetical protein DRP47_04000 [candidate division Zixibacteria bacterium]
MRLRNRDSLFSKFFNILLLVSLTILVLESCVFTSEKQVYGKGIIMDYPSYEKCTDSPDFPEENFGINVCFEGGKRHITFDMKTPWLLFGAYRVDGDMVSEFGSDLDANLLIVVTHKESRGIYYGRTVKDDPPVIETEDEEEDNDPGGRIKSIGSYFNIDLRQQCSIEPLPGKYWVVILLGPLSSPVLEFEVK